MWRVFYIAVEECFGFNDGNDWMVSHYLFQVCSLARLLDLIARLLTGVLDAQLPAEAGKAVSVPGEAAASNAGGSDS